MSQRIFFWQGQEIAFNEGESIAAALAAAGFLSYGADMAGRQTRYFCGIGACQNCLIRMDGKIIEACLTPARAGLVVQDAGDEHV
ncbi:2Fe-2S iron-sulfur cluster-binding protein [Rhizobium sp. S95]|uniref:2Fe-2S iron-sulfur cluster-binding protein n=1 Tax=Ciceribacter sichuanensis TaxID=2949647 RepID=A0AAJ1BV81_9HYPH|nr:MULTISPECIES: 2Fe-2S iron-sulfur cluster-binding protein [unclassified Ciceribacter]MCM2398991.1 2Fe-2S iron-sulfur cluster-binding protein [Ciceribacter sp. S95]MCO5956803.1 2Fe-2S iron-sulfur cluster-binding protein [Ciceribacter sp. S101]